jgi:hypothetical protein
MAGIHVSLCQQKSTRFLGARSRERAIGLIRYPPLRSCASRLVVPAFCRTGHDMQRSADSRGVKSSTPLSIRERPAEAENRAVPGTGKRSAERGEQQLHRDFSRASFALCHVGLRPFDLFSKRESPVRKTVRPPFRLGRRFLSPTTSRFRIIPPK